MKKNGPKQAYKDILRYYYEASDRDIDIRDDGTCTPAAYSVNPFYGTVLGMNDEDLSHHRLFYTFIQEDNDLWRELFAGPGSTDYVDVNDTELADVSWNLNDSQVDALKTAVRMPVSLIQGPPGTGKTHMILALLYVLAVVKQKSVAVVSVNNEAIANITDDIFLNASAPQYVKALKEITAKLGNTENKKAFNRTGFIYQNQKYEFEKTNNWFLRPNPDGNIEKEFRKKYRIITSTPHSLMKLFCDGFSEDAMYDYVIVDETSQMDSMLGLVTMFPAKHLVLVGDNKQIPPIVEEEDYRDLFLGGANNIFMLKEQRSFLDVAGFVLRDRLTKAFGEKDAGRIFNDLGRMLLIHYRCAPGIFEFCRRHFYNKKMEIIGEDKTGTGNPCPMKYIFYRGNFTEKCFLGKTMWRKKRGVDRLYPVRYSPGENEEYKAAEQVACVRSLYQKADNSPGVRVKPKESSRNMRQIHIFLAEEFDNILEEIKRADETDGSYSVCILSPYKAQIYELRERIYRLKEGVSDPNATDVFPVNRRWPLDSVLAKDLKTKPEEWGKYLEIVGPEMITDNEDPEDDEDTQEGISALILKNSKSLTIHSAQGQGFDKVYLMPVDDDPARFGRWEPPFSQQGNLVNVAVSRAKKEFCIIASAELMSDEMKKEYHVIPDSIPATKEESNKTNGQDTSQNRYVDKLIEYIYSAYSDTGRDSFFSKPTSKDRNEYGFHEAAVHTLFEIPLQDVTAWAKEKGLQLLSECEDVISGVTSLSYDEARVDMFLELACSKLGFLFDAVDMDDDGNLLKKYRQADLAGMCMDFAVRDQNDSILCYIEEDGNIHRYRQREDNSLIRNLKDYVPLQKLITAIASYEEKNRKCMEADVRLFRWNSDGSHMIICDGSDDGEREWRKELQREAKGEKWDSGVQWKDQIDKFYEYFELEKFLGSLT